MTPIVILSRDASDYLRLIEQHTRAAAFVDPDEVVERMPDAEVLLADPRLAAPIVGRLDRLRWLQSTWAGVDALSGADAPSHYVLTRVVGVFEPQMREFVFAYLLLHERNVLSRIQAQQAHRWDPPDHSTLSGKTIGVMGTGAIGRAIASAGREFGMRVMGCSRTGRPVSGFDDVVPVDGRHRLAVEVDHLVAVLPATEATRGLVDAEMVAGLGPRAVLVNVGRGSTVDLDAVVEALHGGSLAMAVLDVLPEEPVPRESRLWDVPGLFITAHTAAVSHPEDVAAVFLANLSRWESGRPLEGVVDLEAGY